MTTMTTDNTMMIFRAFQDVFGETRVIHGQYYARDYMPDDLLLSLMGSLDVLDEAERRDVRTRCLAHACVVASQGRDPGPLAHVLGLEGDDIREAVRGALEASDGPEAVRAALSHTVGERWDI